MRKGQKEIYYLGGENKEMLLNSPLLERLTKRGYDVLLMTEPIDEYLVTNVQRYDSHAFVDISKEGVFVIFVFGAHS
jgi:molecular chaperone HtpG